MMINIIRILLIIGCFSSSSFAANEFNFTNQDYNLFGFCIKLVEKGKTKEALNRAISSNNILITKIMNWFYVRDADSGANFNEITKFIVNNPEWPGINKLEARAELALGEDIDGSKIISWFDQREPVTTRGMKLLLEAVIAKNGIDSEQSRALIAKFWISSDFDIKQQNEFIKKYNKVLKNQDYIDKIDHLLWENKVPQAKAILNKVSPDYQRLFLARINFDAKSLKQVPEKLKQDPGLLYKLALKYQIDKDYLGQTRILKLIKNPKSHQKQWWLMKSKLIRELLKDKNYQDAYALAINHNNSSTSDAADANWLAGWIALRFLNDDKSALIHFKDMYDEVKYPVSLARAAYWLGRTAEHSKEEQVSNSWYKIAASYPETFYGQLSITKLDQKYLSLPKALTPSDEDVKNYQH